MGVGDEGGFLKEAIRPVIYVLCWMLRKFVYGRSLRLVSLLSKCTYIYGPNEFLKRSNCRSGPFFFFLTSGHSYSGVVEYTINEVVKRRCRLLTS